MLTIYGELDASPSSIWNKEAVSPSHDGIGDSGERFTRNSFFTPNKCKDSDLTGTGGWVAPRNHPSLTILESHIQRCGEGHVGQGPMAIQPYLDFIWFFSMVGEVAGWFFGITSPAIGIGHFEGAMVFRKLDGWMDGWMDGWIDGCCTQKSKFDSLFHKILSPTHSAWMKCRQLLSRARWKTFSTLQILSLSFGNLEYQHANYLSSQESPNYRLHSTKTGIKLSDWLSVSLSPPPLHMFHNMPGSLPHSFPPALGNWTWSSFTSTAAPPGGDWTMCQYITQNVLWQQQVRNQTQWLSVSLFLCQNPPCWGSSLSLFPCWEHSPVPLVGR